MKKAEDYLKPYKKYLVEGIDGYKNISGDGMFIGDVENAIKQAQIDAIDAAVKMCAEEVETHSMWEEDSQTYYESIDKESILQVADKLKKEL